MRSFAVFAAQDDGRVMQSSRRVLHREDQQRQQQSRCAGDPERRAPSEVLIDQSAQNVASGGADRNGHEEDRHHSAAALERALVNPDLAPMNGDKILAALANWGTEDSVPAIARYMDDHELNPFQERGPALKALGKIKGKRALDVVLKAFDQGIGFGAAINSYVGVFGATVPAISKYKMLSLDPGGGTYPPFFGAPYFWGWRAMTPLDALTGAYLYVKAKKPQAKRVALVVAAVLDRILPRTRSPGFVPKPVPSSTSGSRSSSRAMAAKEASADSATGTTGGSCLGSRRAATGSEVDSRRGSLGTSGAPSQ